LLPLEILGPHRIAEIYIGGGDEDVRDTDGFFYSFHLRGGAHDPLCYPSGSNGSGEGKGEDKKSGSFHVEFFRLAPRPNEFHSGGQI
jgi:hypothetical protein